MPGLTRQSVPQRNKELVGQYIKSRREALGLTQAELLERMGMELWFTALSAIENGDRNLPPHMWIPMAKALQEPIREFAEIMLRYTNPWAYAALFGMSPTLRAELDAIPQRYSEGATRK